MDNKFIRAGEVAQELSVSKPYAYKLIRQLNEELKEKGFITIEKNGRRSYYTPCISQEDYLASQSKNFFEKLCGGNLSVFANALCDSGLTKDEISALRTLLERGEL